MDLKSLLNVLPGGPKAVHVYGKALFPPIADFSVIEEAATQGLFPTIGAIFYPALFYAAVFGILRTVLTRFIFRVGIIIDLLICISVSKSYICRSSSLTSKSIYFAFIMSWFIATCHLFQTT